MHMRQHRERHEVFGIQFESIEECFAEVVSCQEDVFSGHLTTVLPS